VLDERFDLLGQVPDASKRASPKRICGTTNTSAEPAVADVRRSVDEEGLIGRESAGEMNFEDLVLRTVEVCAPMTGESA
jgi:hypothetical protein